MPGMDPFLLSHNLPFKLNSKPIKQKLYRYRPEVNAMVYKKIEKLLEAKFIQPINYPK